MYEARLSRVGDHRSLIGSTNAQVRKKENQSTYVGGSGRLDRVFAPLEVYAIRKTGRI